jgi:hypothetical protein
MPNASPSCRIRRCTPLEAGRGPGGLERHAESAAADLFLQRLDVGTELEKELGDARDDTRLIVADERDGGELPGHAPNLPANKLRGNNLLGLPRELLPSISTLR